MRGEYRRSERLLWTGVAVKVTIYFTTVVIAASDSGTAAGLCLVLACVAQVFLFVSRLSMQSYLDAAQRLRRLAMLQDAIGRDPTPFEMAVLPERTWRKAGTGVPSGYYSSQLPKGAKRLVDLTSECAFFSWKLADDAWKAFILVSIVASGLLVLSLVLVIILGAPQSRLEVIAKWVLIGITFWMTEDLVDMAIRYRSAANSCERILQECFRLLKQDSPSTEDAYVVFREYDAAVASAPPLPSRIYRRHNEELSKIWGEMRSGGAASSAFTQDKTVMR